ncbi:hypothetical protein DERP_011252 [Dermatophagoides pteronyssinus]|uniref:Uncharacterized protein n=1 Tax=Dermatophagoides pteronyssinus TaxID=6956 RepID=A0ABQ8JCK7_DERPT|nr:hypothetical protein DERP_011252 [Dermatophagoides pteronyssinus]
MKYLFSAVSAAFKKGFKKGKFGKMGAAGFNKKFGAVKTFGMAQGFKFGKMGGAFAAGGAAGAAGKKGGKFAAGGAAGFKKGGKAAKKEKCTDIMEISVHNNV